MNHPCRGLLLIPAPGYEDSKFCQVTKITVWRVICHQGSNRPTSPAASLISTGDMLRLVQHELHTLIDHVAMAADPQAVLQYPRETASHCDAMKTVADRSLPTASTAEGLSLERQIVSVSCVRR